MSVTKYQHGVDSHFIMTHLAWTHLWLWRENCIDKLGSVAMWVTVLVNRTFLQSKSTAKGSFEQRSSTMDSALYLCTSTWCRTHWETHRPCASGKGITQTLVALTLWAKPVRAILHMDSCGGQRGSGNKAFATDAQSFALICCLLLFWSMQYDSVLPNASLDPRQSSGAM